ncbi:MAG TPA: hypothetical protein VEB66_10340 [Opitutaceae bacterium]|nr:hypothetical protein [Opitutaceae bacterium]
MNSPHSADRASLPSGRRGPSWPALAAALLAVVPAAAFAQLAPAATTASAASDTPVKLEADKAAADSVVTLSPFEVNTEKDDGFMAHNAGTATKLGLDMKDMSAPYSVMTGEFIRTMGITDLQSAVMWSTNGAPVLDGQGADLFGGGGTSTASTMYNIRGAILNAGQQRNFFLTAAIGDTYNVERIDFGRGPNAVLFNVGANDALGGGISTQGKRPRIDRDLNVASLTVGSWDFYRSTLDLNRVIIPDKLAVRANFLYQKRKGWMDQEFDDRTGVTLSALYKLGPRTELQIEGISDKVTRSRVPLPYFDNLSGWNGATVFGGPITNDQLNGLAPLADGTFLARGATSPTNPAITAYQGQPEGVWRENGNVYIYDPATNSVMNWIHTGSTRRGDETPLTPIYINGVAWSRNNNSGLLPLGNYGASGGNSRTPGVTNNGGAAAFYDMINLPGDLFSRQIAASNFELPGKRFSAMPNEPLFRQPTKDFNFALRHQQGDNLHFELSGDINRVIEQPLASYLGLRTAFIDLNRNLPNGQPNPHFLDPYSQVDMTYNMRRLDNYGLKANVAWIKDAGKWGHYTVNLSGAVSGRGVDFTRYTLSLANAADPREWQAGGQRIRVRYYWNDEARPWSGVNPTTLHERTPAANGNSYTTSTSAIQPRWTLFEWSDREEKTKSVILAAAARWFGNRLILSPGVRIDRQSTYVRNMPASWGFLPNDPSWNGTKLDDRYWRPDAPADWLTLSYIPKNADGTPRSAQPVLANNRPTIPGSNGVNIANPLYANDRFRSDYNNPRAAQTIVMTNVGATYHVFDWMSVKANYGEGYKPLDPARFILDGSDAEPEKGIAYEGGLTFSFFGDRLAISPRYYYNEKINRLGDPPTGSGNPSNNGPINLLMRSRAWNDPGLDGRNPLGYTDVLGFDYFSTKNDGVEVEINGRITRGWRMLANFGTGQLIDYDRWKNTRAYVESRTDEFREVLEAAGGIVDPSAKPFNAGHSVDAAPGLAIPNPAITDAMIVAAGGSPTTRTAAVNAYNNIWVQYDNIGLLADTIGIKRMSAKVYTDYTVQSGRFKGVRFGLGWQYVDKDLAGYRSGDTLPNPNFNAALPVTATNLPWIDDPNVDLNTPVWIKRPSEWTGSIGYSRRLRSRWSLLEGSEIDIQLNVRNLTNKQEVYFQDDGVTLRPPDGDVNAPNRVAVPGRVAAYQRPISFELTTTLKF